MKISFGLIDEVFGIFAGASMAYAVFNQSMPMAIRIYMMVLVPVLVVSTSIAVSRDTRSYRFSWYVGAILSAVFGLTGVRALASEDLMDLDAIASYSLVYGILAYVLSREALAYFEGLPNERFRKTDRPQPDVALAPRNSDSSGICYALPHSEIFHEEGCKYLELSHHSTKIKYLNRPEASASGRRPCKVCIPT